MSDFIPVVALFDGRWHQDKYIGYKTKPLRFSPIAGYVPFVDVVKSEFSNYLLGRKFSMKMWCDCDEDPCISDILNDSSLEVLVSFLTDGPSPNAFLVIHIDPESVDGGLSSMLDRSVMCLSQASSSSNPPIYYFDSSYVLDINNPPNIDINTSFVGKDVMKRICEAIAINNGFEFKAYRSSRSTYTLCCRGEGCAWELRCSTTVKSHIWYVRDYIITHSCRSGLPVRDHKQATTAMISHCIKDKFSCYKGDKVGPSQIVDEMQLKYGVTVSYQKGRRGREMAINSIRGNLDASYGLIPSFAYVLEQMNPGSVTFYEMDADNHFKYFFMCLKPCIDGFVHCKPVISVDGSFLKNKFHGTLLIASSLDGNSHIFPIAFAIVDSENDLSWEWFFTKLKHSIGERPDLVIVSDRHASIQKAANSVFVSSSHVVCMYHLSRNIKLHFKKRGIDNIFFRCAKSYTKHEFDQFMGQLVSLAPFIRQYLLDVGFPKWSRLYCRRKRFDLMTTNISESLNAALREAREFTVVSLLEYCRHLVQKWFYERHMDALATITPLSKSAEHDLNARLHEARRMFVRNLSLDEFQVTSVSDILIVHIRNQTCTCRRWNLDLFSCSHACAAVMSRNLPIYDFINKYYSRVEWLATYVGTIYPIGHPDSWDVPSSVSSLKVEAPVYTPCVGRPRKRRRQSGDELNQRRMKCGRCHKFGHNVRSCKEAVAT